MKQRGCEERKGGCREGGRKTGREEDKRSVCGEGVSFYSLHYKITAIKK